jgi:hypothetical protein
MVHNMKVFGKKINNMGMEEKYGQMGQHLRAII